MVGNEEMFKRWAKNDAINHQKFLSHSARIDSLMRKKRGERGQEWKSTSPTPETHMMALDKMGIKVRYEEYQKDPSIEKLVTGKRVAIVGPAPHLCGAGLGEEIDKYDLVVRINEYAAPQGAREKDYGSKTNIVASCMNLPNLQSIVTKGKEFVNSTSLLLGPMVSLWGDEARADVTGLLDVPVSLVPDSFLLNFFSEVGTVANTGYVTLHTLLRYDVEELFLCGMSFYNMGEYDTSISHREDVYASGRSTPTTRDVRLDIHNQTAQIEHMKKTILEDERLRLDFYLEEAFDV